MRLIGKQPAVSSCTRSWSNVNNVKWASQRDWAKGRSPSDRGGSKCKRRELRFQPPAVEDFSQDKQKDLPRRDRRDAKRYVTGEQRSQIFITFDALPERLGSIITWAKVEVFL